MGRVDPEIQKLEARNARLRAERDKSFAVRASTLIREAISELEKVETDFVITDAAEMLSDAADALASWEPRATKGGC